MPSLLVLRSRNLLWEKKFSEPQPTYFETLQMPEKLCTFLRYDAFILTSDFQEGHIKEWFYKTIWWIFNDWFHNQKLIKSRTFKQMDKN